MAITYGQLKENAGKKISFTEYEKEVAARLKQYVLLKFTRKHVRLCRKLYNQGYTIADAAGILILNS